MAGSGTLIDGLDEVLAEMRKRVASLEQRLTNPAVAVGNGMSVDFSEVVIGDRTGDNEVLSTSVSAPTAVTATASTLFNTVFADIDWEPPVDGTAVEYEVQISEKTTPAQGSPTYATSIVRRTLASNIRIEGLEPLKTYGVKVYSVNSIGRTSDPTPLTGWVDFNTPIDATIPVAITGLTAFAGYASVTLTWDESTDSDVADGHGMYEVEDSTDPAFPNTAATNSVKVSATMASYTGMTTGVVRYFRVRAIDQSGQEGPWSTSVSATPGEPSVSNASDGSAPASSPQPSVTPGVGFLFVRWPAVSNADPVTYEVHLSTADGFVPAPGTRVGNVDGTITSIKQDGAGAALAHDTDYYLKIVATDPDGTGPASAQTGPVRLAKAGASDLQQITAESGIIVSLSAGVISTGTLDADRLGARSVTTEKLTVTALRPNLVANGGFEESVDDPGGSTGLWALGWDKDYEVSGAAMPQYTQASSPGSSGLREMVMGPGTNQGNSAASTPFPVTPGDVIGARVRGRHTGGSGRLYIRFAWYANDTDFSRAATHSLTDAQANVTIGSIVGTYAGQVTVPDGVKFARVALYGWVSATAGYYIFDDLEVRYAATTTTIAPNSITTPLIQAGQVNTDHVVTAGLDATVIKFGTMHGDRITANTLSVLALETGTLSSRTITLASTGYIRGLNAGGGVGWQLSSIGLRLYDSGGTVTVSLNNDGTAMFTGTVNANAGTFSGNITVTGTMSGGTIQTSAATTANRVRLNGDRISWISSTNSPSPAYIAVANNAWGATYGQVLTIDGGYSSNDVSKYSRMIMRSGDSGYTLIIETGDTGTRTDSNMLLAAGDHIMLTAAEVRFENPASTNNVTVANDNFSGYFGTTTGNFFFRDWAYTSGSGTVWAGSHPIDSVKTSKRDVKVMDINALDIVRRAKKVKFRRPHKNSPEYYGFEAENLEAIDPTLVAYLPNGELGGVDTGGLLALLVKSVEQLAVIVDQKADRSELAGAR